MKTKETINEQIQDLINQYNSDESRTIKRVKKMYDERMIELKEALMYIETEPSEVVIQKQIKQLKDEIKVIESRYSNWVCLRIACNEPSSKQSYRNTHHIPLKKKQIKQLKYILD